MAVQLATLALTEQLQMTEVMRDQKGNPFSFVRERGNGARPLIRLSEQALVCPFGLSQWQEQDRKTVSLNVPPDAAHLRQFLAGLDAKVKAHVWEHRAQLFKTPPNSVEVLESFHKSLLRRGKQDYPDTVQVKVTPYTKFFNPDKSEADSTVATKGCKVVAVVSPTRIWAMSSMEFGVGLELRFAMVAQPSNNTPENLFGDVPLEW